MFKGVLHLALLILAFCIPASAQVVFIQGASKDCLTVTSCNVLFVSSNNLGNLIVVAVRSGSTTATVTVSDSQTNVYTNQISQNQTTNGHKLTIAFASNVKAGSNIVTVTVSASTSVQVAIQEYSGIAPSNPVDGSSSSQGSSTSPNSGSQNASQVSDLIFAATAVGGSPTFTAGLGFMLRPVQPQKIAIEDQILPQANSLAGTFTISATDNWSAGVVAFKVQPAYPNITNTFTVPQNIPNIDSDFHNKAPNPWFDISRFGGYFNISPPSTTGTCRNGSPVIKLAAAQDFANLQGIVVYKCGPATILTTPRIPTVTPINFLNQGTTYTYNTIAEDHFGGLTAASPTGTTTTGAATLGVNNIYLIQAAYNNGVLTYTCAVNCNVGIGQQVNITGFPGTSYSNGLRVVITTPSSTTFTVYTPSTSTTLVETGATMAVNACNVLTFPSTSYSGNGTLRYWHYRNNVLVGTSPGLDPYFVDCGQGVSNVPSYIPATPPASQQNQYLVSAIRGGGGTTTLTLADNAATTPVGAQTVLHDNSRALATTLNNAANNGGFALIPTGNFPFNATMDFIANFGGNATLLRISGHPMLNQPWVMKNGVAVEGWSAGDATSFQYAPAVPIQCSTTICFYIPSSGGGGTGFHYKNMVFRTSGGNGTAIYSDNDNLGNGASGMTFDNLNFAGFQTPKDSLVVLKGGFDFFFKGGSCGGANVWNYGYCVKLTLSSPAVTGNTNGIQIPGRVVVDGMTFMGTGVLIDATPNLSHFSSSVSYHFKNFLMESAVTPLIKLDEGPGGGQFLQDFSVDDVNTADGLAGYGTPLIEVGTATVYTIRISALYNNFATLFSGSGTQSIDSKLNAIDITAGVANGATPPNIPIVNVSNGIVLSNAMLSASNGSKLMFAMPAPPAPVSATLGAPGAACTPDLKTNCVPLGTWLWLVSGVDVDGNESYVGPPITQTVTTAGTQTVTITPGTFPAGTTAWYVYRGKVSSGSVVRVQCASIPLATTSWADGYADNQRCGNSRPNNSTALQSGITSTGLTGLNLRIVNNGFAVTQNAPSLTAGRSVTWPDASGVPLMTGVGATPIQRLRVAGCATGSTQFNSCDTTVTWPTAFADTNYTVVCTGGPVASGVPAVEGTQISAAKTGAAVTVRTIALTASAARFMTIECTALHD